MDSFSSSPSSPTSSARGTNFNFYLNGHFTHRLDSALLVWLANKFRHLNQSTLHCIMDSCGAEAEWRGACGHGPSTCRLTVWLLLCTITRLSGRNSSQSAPLLNTSAWRKLNIMCLLMNWFTWEKPSKVHTIWLVLGTKTHCFRAARTLKHFELEHLLLILICSVNLTLINRA